MPVSAKNTIFVGEKVAKILPIKKMEYLSVKQFAEKYGISERSARNYCANGRIEGAFLTGKTWNIPVDAVLPERKMSK